MIVKPMVREYICTTAHPVGCAENVKQQIAYVTSKGTFFNAPKKVLVIGSSTGYGLASRISAAFGGNAATLGVMFEREAKGKRTATAGWYNNLAFEKEAVKKGLYAKTINGDAFSAEVKNQVIQMIKDDLGQIDMLVYSLAAPRRTMADGTVYQSVLKTCGNPYENKTWNLRDNTITTASIPSATPEEIEATIKVMGGEDWEDWMKALSDAGVIAPSFKTVAYSYIGPELTFPIYYHGSIGMAKQDLLRAAKAINAAYGNAGTEAYISVNKGLVTQSSSAIPVVPLYISILYKVMKKEGTHEGCIEQMQRMFADKIYGKEGVVTDADGLIRMDDYEMTPEVQNYISKVWTEINTDNFRDLADTEGYWEDFYHMFGFHLDGIDYEADVEV